MKLPVEVNIFAFLRTRLLKCDDEMVAALVALEVYVLDIHNCFV